MVRDDDDVGAQLVRPCRERPLAGDFYVAGEQQAAGTGNDLQYAGAVVAPLRENLVRMEHGEGHAVPDPVSTSFAADPAGQRYVGAHEHRRIRVGLGDGRDTAGVIVVRVTDDEGIER